MNPILLPILEGAKAIIGNLVAGKVKKEEAEAQLELFLATANQELLKGQQEINKIEAQGDLFRAGWRPFIGWVCGAAMCYQFIVRPILPWAATWAGATVPPMPGLEDVLWELMFGMLGLGGLRSYEKARGHK